MLFALQVKLPPEEEEEDQVRFANDRRPLFLLKRWLVRAEWSVSGVAYQSSQVLATRSRVSLNSTGKQKMRPAKKEKGLG
jgi:hypothetical protein